MSIFDRLKKSNAAVAATATPVKEEAGILPPDAPPSKPELAAKPVEGFEAVPPPRRNLIVNAPTSEPSPSADLTRDPRLDTIEEDNAKVVQASVEKLTQATIEHAVAAIEKKRGPGRPPGAKNKPKAAPEPAPEVQGGGIASDGTPLTMDVEKFWKQKADAQRAAMLAGGLSAIALGDFNDGAIQFESVTVNYGLTLNLGNFSSVRFDVTMGAKGSNPDATYEAVMARVRAKVTEEIEKIQAEQREKQTLNPNGKEK